MDFEAKTVSKQDVQKDNKTKIIEITDFKLITFDTSKCFKANSDWV